MTLDALYASKQIGASAYHFGLTIMRAQTDGNCAAGMLAALCFQAASQGHSCLDSATWHGVYCPALIESIAEKIELDLIFADNALVTQANLCINDCLLVIDGRKLYLQKYWQMERALFEQLHSRINSTAILRTGDSAHDLAMICLQKPLALLTGGPGSGKTTTISRALITWIQAFYQNHQRRPNIILCAPTGKAAARMNAAWSAQKPALLALLEPAWHDALPGPAQTLHRLLAINTNTRQARFNADNPLNADLLVLDEASMVDMQLLLQLLLALESRTHLLLVGDPNQLPSIDAGNVLGALITHASNGGLFTGLDSTHVFLTHNYRQQQNPGLAALTQDCLTESAESLTELIAGNQYPNVQFRALDNTAITAVIADATQFYRQLATLDSAQSALLQLDQRMILTPIRAGPIGCITLNNEIAQRLSNKAQYHGQVVMITENSAPLKLSNGDIGILWQNGEQLSAYFMQGDELCSFDLGKLPAFELAYALTIHKAQGSEYRHVDLLLPNDDLPLLSKALIYTAITRARNSLRVIADKNIFRQSLDRTLQRMNGFNMPH